MAEMEDLRRETELQRGGPDGVGEWNAPRPAVLERRCHGAVRQGQRAGPADSGAVDVNLLSEDTLRRVLRSSGSRVV